MVGCILVFLQYVCTMYWAQPEAVRRNVFAIATLELALVEVVCIAVLGADSTYVCGPCS